MSRFILIFTALFCAILLPAICSGEDVELDTSGRTSLVGIKKLGVSVVVGDPKGEAGVTKQELQDEIEIILQKGGLEVVSLPDKRNDSPDEFVHFRVELFQVSKFGYAFTVDTSVSQIVKTVRTNQFVPASTWARSTIGANILPAKQVKEAASSHAKALVNDWLKANAKGSQR